MEDDIERSPSAKRPCQMATPKDRKLREGDMCNEMQRKAAQRSLNLGGVPDSTMTVKVGGLPKLFLERNFVHCIEKLRDKHNIAVETPGSAIVQTHTYDKKTHTVLIEFRSREIGMEMLKLLHNIHMLNCTLTAHSLEANEAIDDKDDGQLGDCHGISDDDDGLLGDNNGFTPSTGDDIYSASTDDEMSNETEKQLHLSLKVDSNNNGTVNEGTLNTVEVPTAQVTVSDLPDDYDERDLTYEIHKGLWSKTDIKKPHKPIILWERCGNSEAIVTFDSVYAAETAASLQSVELDDAKVTLKQVFEVRVPSSKITVTNLPDSFDERDLIYEMHKAFWCNTEIKKPHKPIISCKRCGNAEAFITFDCVKAAGIAADLKFVELYDCKVNLKQVFEPLPKLVPTCKIKVTQLPEYFEERDLTYEIHKALWAKTEIRKPQKPILSCERSGNGEAIVTLDSVKAAEIAANLKFVELEDTQVKLQQVLEVQSKEVSTCTVKEKPFSIFVDEKNKSVLVNDHELLDFSNHADEKVDKTIVHGDETDAECTWDLFDDAMSSTRVETTFESSVEDVEEILDQVELDKEGFPIVPKGQHIRKDWPTYETLKLIEGVLKSRHFIESKATHQISKGWKNIAVFMYERKLYYSLKNLKKAWKRLLETYPTSPGDWEYRPFIAIFHADDNDNVDLQPLQERLKKYKPLLTPAVPNRGLVDENKYICGVLALPDCEPEELNDLFNEERTLLLIAEYSRKKKFFDDSKHRSIQLFNEIRDAFHLKGYKMISSEDCAKRMAFLARRYKEIEDMRLLVTGSGVEPVAWLYYDAMSQLLEGTAVMNPQKLFACGSSSMMKERATEGRVGRKKPPQGSRKTYSSSVSTASYREQKLEMGNNLRSDLKDLMSLIRKND